MNKDIKTSLKITLSLFVAILIMQAPAMGQAQTSDTATGQAQISDTSTGSATLTNPNPAAISNTTSATNPVPAVNPVPFRNQIIKPGSVPPAPPAPGAVGNIREKIRADIQTTNQNIKNNQEKRNNILEEKKTMSSTSPAGKALQSKIENRIENKMENRLNGSSLPVMIGKDNKRPLNLSLNDFRQKKENAAKQFEVAVNNLKNLRERISARIEKDQQNGRDMSKAKEFLTIADTKLSQLKNAMETLKAFVPADSTTASSTTNIDGARKLVEDVQKSVKESHRALNDVVVAIAKALGQKLGNATSTPPQQTPGSN